MVQQRQHQPNPCIYCTGCCTVVGFYCLCSGLSTFFFTAPRILREAEEIDPANDFDMLQGKCRILSVEHDAVPEIGVEVSGGRGSFCWDEYKPKFVTEDPDFTGEYMLATERTQRSGKTCAEDG